MGTERREMSLNDGVSLVEDGFGIGTTLAYVSMTVGNVLLRLSD